MISRKTFYTEWEQNRGYTEGISAVSRVFPSFMERLGEVW